MSRSIFGTVMQFENYLSLKNHADDIILFEVKNNEK